MPNFNIFKTITYGLCQSVEAYREALLKAGFTISDDADDLLKKIDFSKVQIQADLVIMSVADLGFTEAAYLWQIYAKAKKLGLQLCYEEVGPAFRLAYPNQSSEECVRIAMRSIFGSDRYLRIFNVKYSNGLRWLNCDDDNSDCSWSLDTRFVFVASYVVL